jgi:hypothetical protein
VKTPKTDWLYVEFIHLFIIKADIIYGWLMLARRIHLKSSIRETLCFKTFWRLQSSYRGEVLFSLLGERFDHITNFSCHQSLIRKVCIWNVERMYTDTLHLIRKVKILFCSIKNNIIHWWWEIIIEKKSDKLINSKARC